ncbi:MAG: immune inhibitor A [Anaerolineales bacterium]|nr:immune inhibitor A [Anaerolineales bacterium]
MRNDWIFPGICCACIVILMILCCLCSSLIALLVMYSDTQSSFDFSTTYSGFKTPAPTAEIVRDTTSTMATVRQETFDILENTDIPPNDPYDIAYRLEGRTNIPSQVPAPSVSFQIGDSQKFWLMDTDTNKNFQVDMVLRYITDHSYFWIEDGVSYDESDLEKLALAFEEKIYPTNREFFGSEWTPGVDNDPHIYILYARGLGSQVAGYFPTTDEYTPSLEQYSNGHEMFVFNADSVDLGEEYTFATLAHEFQHMIHWYGDRNETVWINEGFSDLASFLNGYDVGGHDLLYIWDTDLQLNDWPNDQNATAPHYGSSFLFMAYFLDRFGEDASKALVAHPENGFVSIDHVLQELGIADPLSGSSITSEDLVIDWMVTNYLLDEKVGDGRFVYHNYPKAKRADETEAIKNCTQETQTRDVHQYGADYIQLTCQGDYTLHFEGSLQVDVIPADPYSGSYAFWSNKGDESDMTLTRAFDFSQIDSPISLNYWTWYDLEKDFDYLYLEASLDGERWEILHTPSGTADDPTGANYSWGYNGLSGRGDQASWIQESVDLSQFAGQHVQIRFEYITDAGVNGEGFLIDDISVPQVDYATDFENDSGGWEAAGFVRIQNALPQTFRLALIEKGNATEVTYISLSEENEADIPLSIGGDVDEAILVVTGTTRYTRQKAGYQFNFSNR